MTIDKHKLQQTADGLGIPVHALVDAILKQRYLEYSIQSQLDSLTFYDEGIQAQRAAEHKKQIADMQPQSSDYTMRTPGQWELRSEVLEECKFNREYPMDFKPRPDHYSALIKTNDAQNFEMLAQKRTEGAPIEIVIIPQGGSGQTIKLDAPNLEAVRDFFINAYTLTETYRRNQPTGAPQCP